MRTLRHLRHKERRIKSLRSQAILRSKFFTPPTMKKTTWRYGWAPKPGVMSIDMAAGEDETIISEMLYRIVWWHTKQPYNDPNAV